MLIDYMRILLMITDREIVMDELSEKHKKMQLKLREWNKIEMLI